MPCRINRQELWASRIVLEAGCHSASSFWTLTYQEFDVPWQLEPDDLRSFLKRLRRSSGIRLRYYAGAEYGLQTGRPHFHVVLFGYPITGIELIAQSWPFGFVHAGEVNLKTARYVSKYVTKRWIGDPLDPRTGRRPEFSRMSLRPGIGAAAMEASVAELLKDGGSRALVAAGDVPGQVRIEGRRHPLGRYLRERLRDGVGWSKGAPPEVRRALSEQKSLEDVKAAQLKRLASKQQAEKRVEIMDSKRRLR